MNTGPWWLWALVLNLALVNWTLMKKLPELRDPDSPARDIGMRIGGLILNAGAGFAIWAAILIVDAFEAQLLPESPRRRAENAEPMPPARKLRSWELS